MSKQNQAAVMTGALVGIDRITTLVFAQNTTKIVSPE
ncbi:unknown protein [Parachlamydia acanthamoebae UV-7]|jgi:hypothetical protein|uniref:Uncharacterized protein n=1 Tax=Parachlamydia acanthamoebae (strain UV7) TaxID=765952 RepID=F8L1G7_PARAV|nr:unknown protein [Parachlamydia acanthamoebae UV-7]